MSAGNLKALVDYRYEPGAVRPHRVRISAANLDAEDLEALLLPTLDVIAASSRERWDLDAHRFRSGYDQRVDGSVAVDSLHLAGLEVRKVAGG